MQVGLDYQVNLNSVKAQNSFGNAFTMPKIEDLAKTTGAKTTDAKPDTKPDAFEKTPDKEVVEPKVEKTEVETTKPKKQKSLKDGISGIWKFFASADQMVNSTIKGIVYGVVTGAALLGGSWLFKSLPNAFAKEGPGLWNTIRHPLKNISKSGKFIAGIGSAAVLAYNVIKGKLDANQRTAVIDHKMKTGHRN